MQHKYGEFSQTQIKSVKAKLKKDIFFLLLASDPKTNKEIDSDIIKVIENLQQTIGGLNTLLFEPPEIVNVLCRLESAKLAYNSNGYTPEEFKASAFRKLILDAGADVDKIKEV